MTIINKITKQIRPNMKELGFKFSQKCFYRVSNDIACCIQFEKPGSLVYTTFYVMPLYIPCENRYFTYGNRLDRIQKFQLAPLSSSALDTEILNWCDALCDCFDRFIFPLFSQIASPFQLIDLIEGNNPCIMQYFACPNVQIYRLLMFSYFYVSQFEKFLKILEEYRGLIQSSTFFAKTVRDMYFDEIKVLEKLVSSGSQQCYDFCRSTIEESLRNCF